MRIIILLMAFLGSTSSFANKNAQAVIHLLSYLGNDYGGAVKDGKVISESEYKEQIEFSESVEKFALDDAVVSKDLVSMAAIKDLVHMIAIKADSDRVAKKTRVISDRVIKIAGLATSPTMWPRLSKGKDLYEQNCMACHGPNGMGDGPAGKSLEPKPASFHDVDRLTHLSPFQLFNTVTLGVEGTGMISFAHFPEEDRWALAFYVDSIRFETQGKTSITESIKNGTVKLSDVSNKNDVDLLNLLPGNEDQKKLALASIRTYEKSDQESGFSVASVNKTLDDSFKLYSSGQFKDAKLRAVEAYLQEFEPIERSLHAKGETTLVSSVEQAMQVYRSQIDAQVSKEILSGSLDNIKNVLRKVEKVGAEEISFSPALAFVSSFSIVLREGFEAVLILIALIAVLKSLSANYALKWVHGGWISAIVVGVVCWIFSGQLIKMSGASKETMEGVTSLFAVLVLLGIGFWLHQKSQISRWKVFIEGRVKEALSGGKLFALGLIAFTAVFREAIETVLFLRALSLDEKTSGYPVLFGVLSSFSLIFIFSWIMLKFSVKLPIRKLFQFSSLMMAVLAFVLVGKGLKELQEANLIPATLAPIPLRADLLGLFPTYETIFAQMFVLALIFLLMKYSANSRNQMIVEKIKNESL